MKIFPAIDICRGRVARLTGGDFNKMTFYETTPSECARKFAASGCPRIHIVDLEGAKAGRPCNLGILHEISSLGLFMQYGGGLRSEQSIREALDAGASRVMVGSLLFSSAEMPDELFRKFGNAVMPAIDMRKGEVVCSGWLKTTGLKPSNVITELRKTGYHSFLVTDTERDGMMSGIRAELYKSISGKGSEIVAAGGVTTASDITTLTRAGADGAVIGKSLYEGGLTLDDAMKAAKENNLDE